MWILSLGRDLTSSHFQGPWGNRWTCDAWRPTPYVVRMGISLMMRMEVTAYIFQNGALSAGPWYSADVPPLNDRQDFMVSARHNMTFIIISHAYWSQLATINVSSYLGPNWKVSLMKGFLFSFAYTDMEHIWRAYGKNARDAVLREKRMGVRANYIWYITRCTSSVVKKNLQVIYLHARRICGIEEFSQNCKTLADKPSNNVCFSICFLSLKYQTNKSTA